MRVSGPSGPLVLSYNGPRWGHVCHIDIFLVLISASEDTTRGIMRGSQEKTDSFSYCCFVACFYVSLCNH